MTRRPLFTLMLTLGLWLGFLASATAKPTPKAEALLQHAWSYYWAGLFDNGDLSAFDQGLDYAKQARAASKGDPDQAMLIKKIELVEDTLIKQRNVAKVTLRGLFPLTSMLKRSLLIDSGALGLYELIDDPADVAVTRLVEDLRDEVLSKWGSVPQTELTVISYLKDAALEDKVLALLSVTPKINLRPAADLGLSLTPQKIQTMRSGDWKSVGRETAKTLQASRFIIVTLRQVDHVDDLYLLQLDAHVFDTSGAYSNFSIQGVTYDRRPQKPILILLVILFGVFGILLVVFLTQNKLARRDALALGGLAFFSGLGIPNALMSLMRGIEPPAVELIELVFWWPVVAGLVVLLGTPIMFTTIVKRFGAGIPWMSRVMDLGMAVACAVGAGVAAYLARAAIVYDPKQGILLSIFILAGGIGAARLIVMLRLKQVRDPRYFTIALFGLLALGPAFFSASLGLTALCSIALLGASIGSTTERAEEILDIPTEGLEQWDLDMEESAELISRVRAPKYHEFEHFQQALARLEESPVPTSFLLLQGQRGSGKTATSKALIEHLLAATTSAPRHKRPVLLEGTCMPPAGSEDDAHTGSKPFDVFAQAFDKTGTFSIDSKEDEDLFSSIEGKVMGAIPIVALLLPSGDEEQPSGLSDRGEIYTQIAQEIITQTRRGSRQVILWFDDVQWMDKASQELLIDLMRKFHPTRSKHPVVFLLSGRRLPEVLANEEIVHSVTGEPINVELDGKEREELVEDVIGFDERSALMLDEAVSDLEGKSNIAWLLTLVEAVAKSGQVIYDEDAQLYRLTVDKASDLPIPDGFKKIVEEAYKALSQPEQNLLLIATCLGYSFQIEVLAKVLGKTRLEVLSTLESIEEQTGLVEDDLSEDDLYRFASSQRFIALREHLGIQDDPPDAKVPQILRDLHAQIAQVLEGMLLDARVTISDVAAHYWAAGHRNLPKTLEFCNKAATAAYDLFAFDTASYQLRRAIRAAELMTQGSQPDSIRQQGLGALPRLDLQLRLLPYDKAHILGRADLQQTQAQGAWEVFQRDLGSDGQIDVPLRLLVAMTRATYDGRAFDHTSQMAQALIDFGNSGESRQSDPVYEKIAHIEGVHFLGLSLSPREQAEERGEILGRAKLLVDALQAQNKESVEVKALAARVYNSLGEQLSQAQTYDFEAAKQGFEDSIAIKQSLQPQDKPGLARSFGGLGRLWLFAARNEEEPHKQQEMLSLAKGYFKEDITLCEDYGDIAGQAQMHSHLGEVALLEEAYEEARHHYTQSYELSGTPLSQAFALVGLLKTSLEGGDPSSAQERIIETVEILEQGTLPPFMNGMLQALLQDPRFTALGIPQLVSWLPSQEDATHHTSNKEEE